MTKLILMSIYHSGSQTGGKLPLRDNIRFFGRYRGTETTMLFCIMSDHCEILRGVRHNRSLDLGNDSKKFGNH